ncbi:MAG: M60 family metallopeptidase [Spirochaetes bacterium]|nr:M60 family metallopeptidase [Spirochaetota bacterium]
MRHPIAPKNRPIRPHSRLRLPLFLAALLCGPCAADPNIDRQDLIRGVNTVYFGQSFALALGGSNGFAAVSAPFGSNRAAVAVGTRVGKGRLFVFGGAGALHDTEAYTNSDMGTLLVNAARWTASGNPNAGVLAAPEALAYLEMKKVPAKAVGADWMRELPSYTVLVGGEALCALKEGREALLTYLSNGGGLVLAASPGLWAGSNQEGEIKTLYPVNQLTSGLGIAFSTEEIAEPSTGYTAEHNFEALLNAFEAIDLLAVQAQKEPPPFIQSLEQASATLALAWNSFPPADPVVSAAFLAQNEAFAFPTPVERRPILMEKPVKRLQVRVVNDWLHSLPPERMVANAAGTEFPGTIPPKTPRVAKTVSIPTKVPRWHSTGLYAAAGERIFISLPKSATSLGLGLRIGAHREDLWTEDGWTRWPSLSWTWDLQTRETTVASPFGGLIYITVPEEMPDLKVDVRISNAVEAPLFVLGRHTAADWKLARRLPAPWAEFVCRGVVLTVPSDTIRILDDPAPLLQFWEKAVFAMDRLAGRQESERLRPERVVLDRKVIGGDMRYGYPITALPRYASEFTVLPLIRDDTNHPRDHRIWYELGVNQLSPAWIPEGMEQVFGVIFSIHIQNAVCGGPMELVRDGDLAYGKRQKIVEAWNADSTRTFANTRDAGTLFFWELIERWGWDVMRRVITGFRTHPPAVGEETTKWDEWLKRLSQETKRNLGPFFTLWRIPVSQAALDSVQALGDAWLHVDVKPEE